MQISSNVKTSRGVGADILLIDEAVHIDPNAFYSMVGHLSHLENNKYEDDYYSRLLNLKDKNSFCFSFVFEGSNPDLHSASQVH